MAESNWDVIIVGGGPAGATAAYLLAKSGFRTLLLDKAAFPRPKLCAGLITKKTVLLLERLFDVSPNDLQSEQILLSESRRYGINYQSKSLARGRLDYPFRIVDRTLYDWFWLKLAKQAGATVETSQTADDFDASRGAVAASSGEKHRAKYIIGADGAYSKIRSQLIFQRQLEPPKKAPGMGIETFCAVNASPAAPDFPTIYFGYVHKGYAWCFPRGNRHVIGICGQQVGLKNRLQALLDSLQLDVTDCEKIKGHPLPYGNYLIRPGDGNTLLIGDAAGFADPLLGEGIYYAHASAALAALAIVEANRNNVPADRIFFRLLKPTILREMKFARYWHSGVHSILSLREFSAFRQGMRIFQKLVEETIQGDRTFAFLRKRKPLQLHFQERTRSDPKR